MLVAVLWIQIQDFCPIWIWIQVRIQCYAKNLKEKIKSNYRENQFSSQKVYFLRTKMSPKEIFSPLSHWIFNLRIS